MNTSAVTDNKLAMLTQLSKGDFGAFLYDCDGTLADNMGAHKAAYKAVAALYGFDLDVNIIDELAGWPMLAVAEEIKNRYKINFDSVAFTAEKNVLYEGSYINETRPIEFVVEHLKQHAEKYRIGVVSGSGHHAVQKTLEILGISDLVEVIVGAGDTPYGKPFPDSFLSAAQRLGVAAERCLVFEDGAAGVQAAEAAGMKWIRIDKI